jgi:hypothetical protein
MRTARLLGWVAAAAVAVIVPASVVPGVLSQRDRDLRAYRSWRLTGTPCAAAAAPDRPRKTFVLGEASFSYQYGHLTCTRLQADGGRGARSFPVCQFTSPGTVRVESGGVAATFTPGPGRPATVHLIDGEARCVATANPALFDAARDRPFGR